MYNSRKDKDKKGNEIDDLLGISDSSESSSSSHGSIGVYEGLAPFVLELHDIRKDDPMPTDKAPTVKKKHKKKKKAPIIEQSSSSNLSSESLSEVVSTPSVTDVHDEYYDAQSFHTISEVLSRSQGHSDDTQSTKVPTKVYAATPGSQTTKPTKQKP